jgi:glycosyltransferase involved in cell wall biosynthesis
VFLDQHLDTVQMRGLFGLLDCYVSLHRSEGLGLTIATAMAAGTPAIATGWSGNMEFMNAQNSVLVAYDLTEVGPGAYPYPPDACWAEPDLDAAAHAMRELYDHPAMAPELGRRGASIITAKHSIVAAADWFDKQFATLSQCGADV